MTPAISIPIPMALDDTPPPTPADALGRRHAQRLREVYRSAGWPCQDVIEIELLAAGLLQRSCDEAGRDTVRLTDAGIAHVAQAARHNRAARTAHEALVAQVAELMQRDGRIVWTGLSLRADVMPVLAIGRAHGSAPPPAPDAEDTACLPGLDLALPAAGPARAPTSWKLCRPDVFSIRHSSVATYLEPTIHEIKVSRADLLGDLKKADKRAAYLAIGGQCWYVLGQDARGRAIAEPNEVPLECGVLVAQGDKLVLARMAPRRACADLPFHVWMALARSTPLASPSANEACF